MNMDEEVLNMSVRKFLKKVGITSQREIEKAINLALANGDIDQNTICKVSMQLNIDISDKPLVIEGEIHLS
jgi:hypothetical protein